LHFESGSDRLGAVADFRYPQFCALARASELLGERWTLPILRELFVGPQRFSDLRRRLPGLSTSVLAARLQRLARAGVVAQRAIPRPAASSVYELTERGRALEPALRELVRWGGALLRAPEPGDHFEADWLAVGLAAMARRGRVPPRRLELRLTHADGDPVALRITGTRSGTQVLRLDPAGAVPARERVEATLHAPALTLLAVMSGALDLAAALAQRGVSVQGDASALADLPRLFDFAAPGGATSGSRPTQPTQE
jgi:DNA-binding HxlR family transcriptional regulator